ncbi:MAG: TIGR01457 family HAD-type hydrolase [Lactobacillus sp.]|uniref:Acid sugar phosphatase n=1 Tax=Lacticaseibacillus suilingensis TaxID=2799577 RepID=A0ABW4BH37_9LACO|nr:TIGR01457 family HAD-type hydrolase [Lacticaseibacillus suilingensis]MCI1893774.1 TIGR01457 family HAD-type hydrolase [Lactobacillus sp.]MCI1918098.1 TIGR01457 family HAD-type hydrolase [Lactobacillus sp.]MCI1941409.1 TIGR01457 family HAD-type hydrolase [Lactobacillus sp.]MCI1971954.1 TIGR01457 family HAD-type hydrolase [Lactobacillus sp.]MCI2017795.1 TIGR01457 family HAD-type hydrolase [Lactobacillus sp.]
MTYQGYMIDLDGTMYRGKERIPEAKAFVERLQAKHIPFLFLTNNTTKSPADVCRNLAENHDIHADPAQVYTPSLATASWIQQQNGGDARGKSVYVIGELGLKQALLDVGLRFNEYDPDYVVVGLDYDVTYHKFELATLAIQRGGMFIGTNADTNLPNERGHVPGAGSVIALVERSTQRKAFYIGKPESIIMTQALHKMGLTKEQVVMVGDNYNTDIKAGINAGIDTLLVYTGISTRADVAQQTIKPTHEVASLADWEV